MQVLTAGNTGTQCMFLFVFTSYVSRLGQIENISYGSRWLSLGGYAFYGVLGWLNMWMDGWAGRWNLPGDIRLGIWDRAGRDGTGLSGEM